MTFKVVNKYLQETNKTFVAIRQDAPYTAFDRVLIGDRSQEIFTIEDASHNALYGEGNRVMVQVNSDFTYNGETLDQLASLEQNGKLAVWKWTKPKEEPKPAGELETQPVQ